MPVKPLPFLDVYVIYLSGNYDACSINSLSRATQQSEKGNFVILVYYISTRHCHGLAPLQARPNRNPEQEKSGMFLSTWTGLLSYLFEEVLSDEAETEIRDGR